jgi:hypothetical protein
MSNGPDYCIFILTHGRPDKVTTFNTLQRCGYSGQVFLIVDNEDDSWAEYVETFGADNVIFFDKRETAKRFDEFDNFDNRATIVYARNECFEIARKLGYKYFLELDDDYCSFGFRLVLPEYPAPSSWFGVKETLTEIIEATFDLFRSIPAASIAFSQGGDWIGGKGDKFSRRKCMNTFFCSTLHPFNFVGRINEDVNTYTATQSRGVLFLTLPWVQVVQKQTQKNKGGMSEIYLAQGTFIKSFYSVICAPSCVSIKMMGDGNAQKSNRRMHHSINWSSAVPMLIDNRHKKGERKKVLPPPPRKASRIMTVAEINSTVIMPEKRIKPEPLTKRKSHALKPPEKPFDEAAFIAEHGTKDFKCVPDNLK